MGKVVKYTIVVAIVICSQLSCVFCCPENGPAVETIDGACPDPEAEVTLEAEAKTTCVNGTNVTLECNINASVDNLILSANVNGKPLNIMNCLGINVNGTPDHLEIAFICNEELNNLTFVCSTNYQNCSVSNPTTVMVQYSEEETTTAAPTTDEETTMATETTTNKSFVPVILNPNSALIIFLLILSKYV